MERWMLPDPAVDISFAESVHKAVFLASDEGTRRTTIKRMLEHTPEPEAYLNPTNEIIEWSKQHVSDPLTPIPQAGFEDVVKIFVLGGLPVEGITEEDAAHIREEAEEMTVYLKERLQSLKGTLT